MGKRQHYVPQFYLRGFSGDCKSIGFFRFNGEVCRERVPIKSIMFKNWLYDDDGHVEETLSALESNRNVALSDVLDSVDAAVVTGSKWNLPDDAAECIAPLGFVCCSMTRTASILEDMQAAMLQVARDMKEACPSFDHRTIPQLESLEDQQSYAEPVLQASEELLLSLVDLEWAFLIDCTGRGFLTSDNPVVQLNTLYAARRMPPHFGLKAGGLQILMPLGPRVALLLYDSDVYETEDGRSILNIKSAKELRAINAITVKNAAEQVAFAPGFPLCELKGMARARRQRGRVEVAAYESAELPVFSTITNVKLSDALHLDGLKIKEEAMRWPIPADGMGFKRAFTHGFEIMNQEPFPEDVPHRLSGHLVKKTFV